MQPRKRTLLVVCLAAAIAAAGPARAGDAPADVKEAIAYFDKYAPKARDDTTFADLVHDLASTREPAAAERIARILTEDKNSEHHMIATDVLGDFSKGAARDVAGKALVRALQSGGFEEEMQMQIVESIGKLRYVPGCLPIGDVLLKSDSPWLMLRCVRSLGLIDDLHALPALLEILERFPVGYKWPAGAEVTVDTGASGDTDQKAAEAQYNSENAAGGKKGKPPVMFKAYMQELKKTVQGVTDDATIDGAITLRAWMVARTEELKKLGIEIPKFKGEKPKDGDPKRK